MRKSCLFLVCFSFFLGLNARSVVFISTPHGEHGWPSADALTSIVHVVITRTIVIDHSPFPDLARSVDNAIIKEGEAVELDMELANDPCSFTDQRADTQHKISSAVPNVAIVTKKNIICEGETNTLTATGAASYSWSTGEQTESILVNPDITSTYFVIGANKPGCTKVAYYVQQVEGCHGPQASPADLHIFPNPSSGSFFVKVQSPGKNRSLQIYNDFGNLVKEEKIETTSLEIDLNGQPDGIYLMRLIELGKEIQRKRLYKTH